MDASSFDDVKYVVNVDGFSWGRLIAGSAGGSRETYITQGNLRRLSELEVETEDLISMEVSLMGFHGGHSGFDIDRGRANAIKLLGRTLACLKTAGVKYHLASCNGGIGHNVIPGDASAVLVFHKRELSAFQHVVFQMMQHILSAYSDSDPDGVICYQEIALPEYVLDEESQARFLSFLDRVKNGVLHYMKELHQVVDTSSNLGMVRFCANQGKTQPSCAEIRVMSFARSMTEEYHDEIISSHRDDAVKHGFSEVIEEYRTWHFDPENPLISMMSDAYREITGKEPEVTAVHVGLEPSAFCEKKPDLYMINVGADIIDPHTIHERIYVDTVEPFARLMAQTLEKISKERVI